MSEFEALNLMYLGFTFNALYTLGFILFTWLGFRMARNIYEDTSATMLGKVFTSIYCLFVAFFFIQSNMIGGGILQSYTEIGLYFSIVCLNCVLGKLFFESLDSQEKIIKAKIRLKKV